MLKQATTLLILGLSACVGYKKELPPVEPPQRQAAPEVFKFSDKARQTRLATILFDLPLGHKYGESPPGGTGVATTGNRWSTRKHDSSMKSASMPTSSPR